MYCLSHLSSRVLLLCLSRKKKPFTSLVIQPFAMAMELGKVSNGDGVVLWLPILIRQKLVYKTMPLAGEAVVHSSQKEDGIKSLPG